MSHDALKILHNIFVNEKLYYLCLIRWYACYGNTLRHTTPLTLMTFRQEFLNARFRLLRLIPTQGTY